MALNLYNSAHKTTNEKYRKGYEQTFGKKEDKVKNENKSTEDKE